MGKMTLRTVLCILALGLEATGAFQTPTKLTSLRLTTPKVVVPYLSHPTKQLGRSLSPLPQLLPLPPCRSRAQPPQAPAAGASVASARRPLID